MVWPVNGLVKKNARAHLVPHLEVPFLASHLDKLERRLECFVFWRPREEEKNQMGNPSSLSVPRYLPVSGRTGTQKGGQTSFGYSKLLHKLTTEPPKSFRTRRRETFFHGILPTMFRGNVTQTLGYFGEVCVLPLLGSPKLLTHGMFSLAKTMPSQKSTLGKQELISCYWRPRKEQRGGLRGR